MKKWLTVLVSCLVTAVGCFSLAACGGNELAGFDIDMAKAFAESEGVEVEFRLISWGEKEMELASGRSDLVWNGLTVTDERAETMELSDNYLRNYQAVVIRKDDREKFKSKQDLIDKEASLCAEVESAGAEQMDEIKAANGNKTKAEKDQRAALLDVKSKHYDAAIVDATLANYLCNSEGSSFNTLMVIPDLVLVEEHYAVAAKKGSVGLIAKVNDFFKTAFDDGSLRAAAVSYGLDSLLEEGYGAGNTYDGLTDAEKSSWSKIKEKGKLVVAYTLNPPIALNK